MSFPAADEDRQSDELTIFHDVAKALTSSLDLDAILQTIMEKLAAYFGPGSWSLLMLDETSREFYYAAAVGNECEKVNALRLRTGETLARWVIEHGEPLVVLDVNGTLASGPAAMASSLPRDVRWSACPSERAARCWVSSS